MPSLGPEGLPRVALEAMESGVPVVAHRIGSLSELGNAAMFVCPPPIAGYELDEAGVLTSRGLSDRHQASRARPRVGRSTRSIMI